MTNLSLCSGYGGLDLAVEQITGNKTLVYAENDPFASRVMEARFPWATNLGDITKIGWRAIASDLVIDSVSAGFPCQDISNAGLRKGITGARSGIWKDVVAAICSLRPRLVFLENVAAIRSRGLDVVAADLAAIGYDARWTCLRAGDEAVGAPHPRDRWFCIAHPADAVPERLGWNGGSWDLAEAQGRNESADRGHQAAGAPGELTLVPSPLASDGGLNRGSSAGWGLRNWTKSIDRTQLDSRWVDQDGIDYTAAIRRWERALGRPAPDPTEPGARGKRRLTPPFTEWLMGVDAGWVTSLDLSRRDQLRILGNGVVTRQAVEGYRRLLTADLEAMAA